ncbi:MAG: hypothetical protein V7L20_04460 [Nostoc sp.]|uniref:hypothetical protein n=1 Tax=Nostoc sp. TaxID=1180 RepID=UPI002FF9CC9F
MKNTQAKINQPLNETACKHNQNKLDDKKKLTCTKNQGSCLLEKAKVSIRAITDVVHLVHGAIACTL